MSYKVFECSNAVAANGLLPEAVGEIKLVRLVKDSKADERKKSLKSYFAPMATRQMLAVRELCN